MKQFIKYCCNGNIDMLKEAMQRNYINIHKTEEGAFRAACRDGHLNIVIYLCNLYKTDTRYKPININIRNESAFRAACREGRYDIVVYLTQLYQNDINYKPIGIIDSDGFNCAYRYIDIIKYLSSLYQYDNNYTPIKNIYNCVYDPKMDVQTFDFIINLHKYDKNYNKMTDNELINTLTKLCDNYLVDKAIKLMIIYKKHRINDRNKYIFPFVVSKYYTIMSHKFISSSVRNILSYKYLAQLGCIICDSIEMILV